MVLKLYGSAMATSRVLMTILEKDLPYELVRIDIPKGEQYGAEYAKLQPFRKVPALDDDGFVIFESRAICKYLERKYPTALKLIPEDDQLYARFEQACSVEQSYFAAAAESIGTELFIKPAKGLGEPDLAKVAEAESQLDQVLAYYNDVLATQRYIAGNQFTLADIFHLPNGAALKAGKWMETFQNYPNVDQWFKSLQEMPTWKTAASLAGTLP